MFDLFCLSTGKSGCIAHLGSNISADFYIFTVFLFFLAWSGLFVHEILYKTFLNPARKSKNSCMWFVSLQFSFSTSGSDLWLPPTVLFLFFSHESNKTGWQGVSLFPRLPLLLHLALRFVFITASILRGTRPGRPSRIADCSQIVHSIIHY